MNILINILVGLAALVALFFIIALFIKKEYTISREIVINKPKTVVFQYIKHLRNQERYNKWVMMDPGMKKDLKGADGTVGFTYAWDSQNKQAGKGEQEIVKIVEGDLVDVEVRFERPFKSVAKTPLRTVAITDQQTKVIWGMEATSKYPLNAMNPFMDALLGKDLEASLINLKNILEK